jgi:EAL domain-containing protein (putative c-di-GMP-specific phosphodiesterase class I)
MVIPSLRYLRGQAAQSSFLMQPIRSFEDGDVVMYELSRVLPEISEERFVSYTTRFGLVEDVEILLLEAAAAFAAEMSGSVAIPAVSVNVHAGALTCRLADRAVELAQQIPTQLILELSEDTASEDIEDAAEILRDRGVLLLIDHIGRGASDSYRARRLGARAAKLDSSMLTIERTDELHAFMSRVPPSVQLSAAGVEDLEQVLLCVNLGIRWGQGDAMGAWSTRPAC